MSLVSFAFLLGFFPVVVIGTHLLRDRYSARAAQGWLLGASLLFYFANGGKYVVLMLASATFNWAVGRALGDTARQPKSRTRLLQLGLAGNILLLSAFKYTHFLYGSFAPVIGLEGELPQWVFPLGISFFTLAQIMYLVDCYEKLIKPNSLFDHATFVSFFPNVTAGPIERAKHFVGQLGNLGGLEGRDERIARGIMLMAIGLFKKAVIADSFARVANAGYATADTLSAAGAWITSLAFTFQLYFDFSGYSDIAFGAGRVLGIDLVRNFNTPFRSKSIVEFWQRWHISLSSFITTYLYTPLIRRMGKITIHKAAMATIIAMTLAGLWHGPAWTFVLYGMVHGLALAANQYWKKQKRPLPPLLAMVLSFLFVNVSLILFHAPNVSEALEFMGRLFSGAGVLDLGSLRRAIPSAYQPMIIAPILIGCVTAFAGPNSDEITAKFTPSYKAGLAVAGLVVVSFMFMLAGAGNDFVYRAF